MPPIGSLCCAVDAPGCVACFRKAKQVGALPGILYASERHFIARHEMLRISDPVI
jgi:hypothetical protein